MAKTYSELLQDPRWQKKRLEGLEEAGWRCENCGASDITLHVHHIRYIKGRQPWEYSSEELQVLCKHCHQEHHETDKALDIVFSPNNDEAGLLVGVVAGFLDANLNMPDEAEVLMHAGCSDGYIVGVLARMVLGCSRQLQAAIAAALVEDRPDGTFTPAEDRLMRMFQGGY